jgi:hypothetical protein
VDVVNGFERMGSKLLKGLSKAEQLLNNIINFPCLSPLFNLT